MLLIFFSIVTILVIINAIFMIMVIILLIFIFILVLQSEQQVIRRYYLSINFLLRSGPRSRLPIRGEGPFEMTSIIGPDPCVSPSILPHSILSLSISPSSKLPELLPLSSIPRSAEPVGVEYLQQQGLSEYQTSTARSMIEDHDLESKLNFDFADQQPAQLGQAMTCEAETDQYV